MGHDENYWFTSYCVPPIKAFSFSVNFNLTLDAVCEVVVLFRSVGEGLTLTVLGDCGEAIATSTVQRKVSKYLDTP